MDYNKYAFSQERLTKREKLIANGIDPFGSKGFRTHYIADLFNKSKAGECINILGRIKKISDYDSRIAVIVEDVTGSILIEFDINRPEKEVIILQNIDTGDFINCSGVIATTDLSVSVIGTSIEVITKTLCELPSEEELKADKIRQRKERYVDLAVRKDAVDILKTRINLIRNIRDYLNSEGMYEVETPMLRSHYDLVCDKQFEFEKADGGQLYLRLCHEDRLKQLIAGGFEKVYELGKSFRPSDGSWKHITEFLQLETIQAYTDYWDMMMHAEDMYKVVTERTIGKTSFIGRSGDEIDLANTWTRISVRDAIYRSSGIDIFDYNESNIESFKEKIIHVLMDRKTNNAVDTEKEKNDYLPPTPFCNWFWKLVDHCIDSFVAPDLKQPTILYDYPVDSNWLCKRKKDKPDYIERFEAYIDGIEIANCYTLVNDVLDFIGRLEGQRSWYFAAFGKEDYPLDRTLINAKAYGLPPMSESSFGIERWLMMICEQESIQDVIWMPYPYV